MFKGKAIYNPSGKAGEYSYWACNFYVGCSNGCTYCYLKKGRGAKTLGGDVPALKKCFKDEGHAIEIFKKELFQNLDSLRTHGLFFSFTTDPALKETYRLTLEALSVCQSHSVPVKILTKNTYYAYLFTNPDYNEDLIALGVTLTGWDSLEPLASLNNVRAQFLRRAKFHGFKTFASIEPIIDFQSSKMMIRAVSGHCDLIKVGLESGKKYDKKEAVDFVLFLSCLDGPKIYIKESLRKLIGKNHEIVGGNFVSRNYNIFKGE